MHDDGVPTAATLHTGRWPPQDVSAGVRAGNDLAVDGQTSIGTRLGERYELGHLLGRGGMGEVRVGNDLRLGRTVAVKVMRPALAGDDAMKRRFEDESRATARIVHPNVVQVYDYGEDAGCPYIVMEYAPGPTLADELRMGPVAAERALSIACGIAHGLAAAHASGVVHRDIKPANVVLVDDVPKLTDFGIAKILDGLDRETTAVVLGTYAYVAPERLSGASATSRSDVYSAGVVLREMLVAPTDDWSRLDAVPDLAAIVERATKVEPDLRYEDGAALAADLERATVPVARGDARWNARDAPTLAMPGLLPVTSTLVPPARPAPHPRGSRVSNSRRARLLVISLLVLIGFVVAVAAVTSGGAGDLSPAATSTTTAATAPSTSAAPPAAVATVPPTPPTNVAHGKRDGRGNGKFNQEKGSPPDEQ